MRPINSEPDLPRGSVWVVRRVVATGLVELASSRALTGLGCCAPIYVKWRSFYDRNLEKVTWVRGTWQGVDTGHISGAATFVASPVADPVKSAASALEAAEERARKAREEAKAIAKAEAKRKAADKAAKKAIEEHEAVARRLNKDRDLAEATSVLLAELSRLHDGGAEQPAAVIIARHVEQLQPLAKSYGYKIAKPGVIAIVVKA